MIIVKTHGGLGNQFFQYAAGKALANFHNVEFKFEISSGDRYLPSGYCLDKFAITAPIANEQEVKKFISGEKPPAGIKKFFLERLNFLIPYYNFLIPYRQKKVYYERFFQFNTRFFNLSKDVYLDGYFQSERYFKKIENEIKKEFVLKNQHGDGFKKFAAQINNCNSVSIHFRRGDYVTHSGINKIFGITPVQYYYDAVKKIAGQIENPHFFIFSNDLDWVKENFNLDYPVTYVTDPSLKFYEEMTLMSFCRHNIIANSSYSWWSAWLNNNPEKIIIAPKTWFRWWKFNCKDIIPPEWIKI